MSKVPSNEEWVLSEVSEIDLYEKREKIYTRKMEGFFQRLRVFTGWPLLIGYFGLPWINWQGQQAVLFDLPNRQFHIFELTFWPQDLSLLGLLLIIAAFALFFVTTLFGRIWCGYTCPQTVWTSIFMWLEQKTEGTRNQRIRLDAEPTSVKKITKKLSKHTTWLAVSFATGLTFVGYFTPIAELSVNLWQWQAGLQTLFWIAFFTLATYANAGWMREQVCQYMCPYARFQSVMFDADTLIVSYDKQRGDPRGSRKRNSVASEQGLGDCIDCQLCVQVCPTGIDIREGLQYQCIACALCVDACDSIMDKMDYPTGLISYTTENNLQGGKTQLVRPKSIAYGLILVCITVLFTWQLASVSSFEATVIHDRQSLTNSGKGNTVENRYLIRLSNKTNQARAYKIALSNPTTFSLIGDRLHDIDANSTITTRIRVSADKASLLEPITTITFTINDDSDVTETRESRFIYLAQ